MGKNIKELKQEIYKTKKELLKKYKKAKEVFYNKNLTKAEKENWFTTETENTLFGQSIFLDKKSITSDYLSNDPIKTKEIIDIFSKEIKNLRDDLYGKIESSANESNYNYYNTYYISDFFYQYNYYVFKDNFINKSIFKEIKKNTIIKYLEINNSNFNCNIVTQMLKGKIDINIAIELMQDCKI